MNSTNENRVELRTDWQVSGIDVDDLSKVIDEIDKHTKIEKVHTSDFDILSFKEKLNESFYRFYMLDCPSIDGFEQGAPLKTIKGQAPSFNIRLLKEISASTNLMVYLWSSSVKNRFMYVSEIAMFTLLQRASIGGDASSKMNTLARNVFLTQALKKNPGDMSIVYRDDDAGNKVIFAVMGYRYERISQKLIVDTALNLIGLKGAKCSNWSVNHKYTNVTLTFPDMAEKMRKMYGLEHFCLPTIILRTSDVGLACFDAIAGYTIDGNFVITDSIKHKHIGEVSAEALAEEIEDNLLADVRKLPETLAELMTKSVSEPEELIKCIWKEYLSCISGFVKKNLPIKEQMLEVVEETPDLTGYDIAMLFITMQDRLIGLNDSSLRKLQKACAQIPYKINRLLGMAERESSSITLFPVYSAEMEGVM
mgnify:CR=1 FL=1